jgi:hypothetical protein
MQEVMDVEEIIVKTEHKKEEIDIRQLLKSLELQVPESHFHDSDNSDLEGGFKATFVPGKDSKPGVHVADQADGRPHGIRLLAYRRSVDESMEEFEDMLVPEKMDNIEAGIPEHDEEEMPPPPPEALDLPSGEKTLDLPQTQDVPQSPEKTLRSPTEEAKAYYSNDIEKAVRMMEEEEAPNYPEYVPPHEEERRNVIQEQKGEGTLVFSVHQVSANRCSRATISSL